MEKVVDNKVWRRIRTVDIRVGMVLWLSGEVVTNPADTGRLGDKGLPVYTWRGRLGNSEMVVYCGSRYVWELIRRIS